MVCPNCKNTQAYRLFGPSGEWRCDECAGYFPSPVADQYAKNVKKSQEKLGNKYKIVPPDRKRGIVGGVFTRNDGKEFNEPKKYYT